MWRRVVLAILTLGFVALGFTLTQRFAAKKSVEDRVAVLLGRARPGAPVPKDLIHPDLLLRADTLQLGRMLTWMTRELGPFEGLALGGFEIRERPHGGGLARGGKGDLRFQRGVLAAEVYFLDAELIHFGVLDPGKAAALAAHLAVPPDDLGGYLDRGRDFFARAFGGEAAGAYAMLHPGLAKEFGNAAGFEARLKAGVATGELDLVEVLGTALDTGHPSKVHLRYRVTTSSGAEAAHLTLQFRGLGSHIVGFQIPSELPGESQ